MYLDRPKFETFPVGTFPTEGYDTVELKYDGILGIVEMEDTDYRIWSRNGLVKDNGKLVTPVKHTILYGEYLFASEWAKDRPLLYNKVALYGAKKIEGVDVEDKQVESVRLEVADLIKRMTGEGFVSRLFLAPRYPLSESQRLWDEMVVKENYEGLIFRNSFESSWGGRLGRMKNETTMDYVCIGFDASTAESYTGTGVACIIGGLYVNGSLQKACKVAGITDEQRYEFFQHPEKYVGKVFQARGKRVSKKGALRHPEFMLWRDDKKPTDCTWS